MFSPLPSEVPDLDRIVPVLLEHGLERLPEHCSLSPGMSHPGALRKPDTADSWAQRLGLALLQAPLALAPALQGSCEVPTPTHPSKNLQTTPPCL